jgi:hypothetical protein
MGETDSLLSPSSRGLPKKRTNENKPSLAVRWKPFSMTENPQRTSVLLTFQEIDRQECLSYCLSHADTAIQIAGQEN